MKASIWKWLILVVVTAWSVALVTPPKDKVKLGLDLQGGTSYTLEVDDSQGLQGTVADARDRAIEVVRNRVDSMGVAEPSIYPDGEKRIVVQIPGMKTEDRLRASENIRKAAFLEFRMVHPKNDELISNLFKDGKVPEGYEIVSMPGHGNGDLWVRKGPPPTEAERVVLRRFEEKVGYDLLFEKEVIDGKDYFRPYYVSRKAELTGDSLKSANVDFQQFGQKVVQISFDSKGRKIFAKVTADHAPGGAKNPDPNGRHYLGIVLDNTLYSAPFIRTSIPSGEAVIEGAFTLDDAKDLALVLRAGALPAPLRVLEERTVDPTLGTDSIQSGWRAAWIGFVIVSLFMVAYYHFAGIVAVLALVLNLILLPIGMIITAGFFGLIGGAGMGSSGVHLPVLTLPGIAGIVLTMGMAVDANVLIFERIREEMRLGKRFGAAISAGYDKAFSTILDSNLTTLLTAVILFWMGSGPVKGFAVTLTAGIIASMYTSITCTRMVFDFLEHRGLLHNLKMTQWVKDTKIDFMRLRWPAAILSVAVIVSSLAVGVQRGKANFGVDFTGGQQLSLSFTQKAEVDGLRKALEDAGIRDVGIQYQRSGVGEEQNEVLAVKVASPEEGLTAQKVLGEQFTNNGFKLIQEDTVGPQVGKELQRGGLLAIGLSLVGMIIYITIRFEFSFAIGSVVGLIHNLLVTIGLYCVFHRQFTTTTIAALLTVLGYSINDTIVVFDRIREMRKLHNGRLDPAIVNESVNATLSRTTLTALTVLLSTVTLMVFGGGSIFDFALAMFIGVVAGTYSSIFIASPVMLAARPKVATAPAGK
jgi:SecD/SecF fusion protein